MTKRVGVLIGRFQGYHKYHHKHIQKAASENDIVLVLIGSSNARRSIKNPFTFAEREAMIRENIMMDCAIDHNKIVLLPSYDIPYDDASWANSIVDLVDSYMRESMEHFLVSIYGSEKDQSSFYLKMFPEWELRIDNDIDMEFGSTNFRESWFKAKQTVNFVEQLVTNDTLLWLYNNWIYNSDIQGEWDYYEKEKVTFGNYPYPETLTFSCADAVVRCHNKVLMIRRKNNPGKGCLALPGGFKNRNETFLDAALRELAEETGLDIRRDHNKFLVSTRLFDSPYRSLGIPRSTLAVYFDMSRHFNKGEYPAIQASDDAASVEWVSIDGLFLSTEVYDDHAAIIQTIMKGM